MAQVSTELTPRSRGDGWLDRPVVHRLVLALLMAEVAVFIFMIVGTHGWIVPLQNPTTTDFVSFYAAGTLANAGVPQLAYDHAAHFAAEQAITGPGIEYQFFNYPPVFLLLCSVLARLPYLVAFVVFEVSTLALYVVVARRVLNDMTSTAALALVAFPVVFWNVGLGQNALLTAALFGGATLLVDRKPVGAGLCFGALCYKPHFGLLIPVALAAGRRWRCFAAAASTVAVLVGLSIASFGWQTWHDFLLTAATSHSMYESGRILFSGFVSPFGAVRLLGGGVLLAYGVQFAAALVAVLAVGIVWYLDLSLPVRAAILATGTLIAIPLSLLYDLMLPAMAACWLWRDDRGGQHPNWEKALMIALFLGLLDPRGLSDKVHLPLGLLAIVSLFGVAVRRACIEVAYSRPKRAAVSV
jgi:alpha-1,2-mannosyltransferase